MARDTLRMSSRPPRASSPQAHAPPPHTPPARPASGSASDAATRSLATVWTHETCAASGQAGSGGMGREGGRGQGDFPGEGGSRLGRGAPLGIGSHDSDDSFFPLSFFGYG